MGRLIDESLLQEKLALIPMEERTFRRTVEELENAPTVEAIPKADYETRLKADILAVLEKIADEINKRIQALSYSAKLSDIGTKVGYMYSLALIRANIHALKENEDGNVD